ncbi:glycoside hydrolase family 108 protein [Devosia limi]|uniref:Lysozyme family protein n=1 Tax=Devosia limi DSM 17137 TaxID=1121477 RepID=A0A1M4T3M0_9HYPH|nr:glycoside hydrolase family 108 protein [Devosia limi]SHE39050.1 Lysozyme family protein [Devosia limi DSM 17137]
MARSRFDICLDEVLRHEGGFANHPSDPGGATNLGITRKTLARWRNISPWWALGVDQVKALGRGEAARIYRSLYWERANATRLPPGLDLAVFDFAVNSGPDRAIKLLQRELGVLADGWIGPLTLAAIGSRNVAALVNALCDRRMNFLNRLSTFATFGKGWSARVAAIRKAALAMADSVPLTPTKPDWSQTMAILAGYRTYIIAAFMLLAGLSQMLGIDLPSLEGSSAGQLIMEALAVIFLRQGLKGDISRA